MKKIFFQILALLLIAFAAQAQHYKHYGVTVAGNKDGIVGNDSMHLDFPQDFFVDKNKNVYVVRGNKILLWERGSIYGKTIVYDTSFFTNLGNVFVDDSEYIYYIREDCVEKRKKGSGISILVAGQKGILGGIDSASLSDPTSIWVDRNGNIYIADYLNNRVQKWAPGAKYGVTVAGMANGDSGSDSIHLNGPSSVFVDTAGNLFVADMLNNRIMEYSKGAKYGIMVAGDGTAGTGMSQLNHPSFVFVDMTGNIYTIENNNNRIQFWLKGAKSGRTIISSRYCSDSTCIYYPAGISVDAAGNIYVCDYGNSRVTEWIKDTTCDAYFVSKPDTGLLEHLIDSSYTLSTHVNYNWSFGDSSYSNLKSPIHKYKASINYKVCLNIYDSTAACSATFCELVKPRQSHCQAYFTFISDSQRVVYYDSSFVLSNHINYSWDFGDSTYGSSYISVHMYKYPGVYKVCENIYDSVTTCSSNYCTNINVACYAIFNASIDTSLTASFRDSSYTKIGKILYKWYFGDGDSSTTKNPSHTYSKAGTYTVCEYIIDSVSGCTSNYCMPISVLTTKISCSVMIIANVDTTLTASFSDSLYTSGTKPLYKWTFGDGSSDSISSPIHTYSKAGTYNVCLYILNRDSAHSVLCYTCDSIRVGVFAKPCVAHFTIDSIDTLKKIIFITNRSVGADSTLWTFGDGDTSWSVKPTHTYGSAGSYTLCMYILCGGTSYSIFCDTINGAATRITRSGGGYTIKVALASSGTNDIAMYSRLKVFPNPVNQNAFIELPDGVSKGTLIIKNVLGQSIKTIELVGHKSQVDLNNLPAGFYIMQLESLQGQFVIRIIKQ